tara:strand:+ start:725 stop:910 length:186 start_codon:yes stop_codon:yes gene_type:complete
MLNVKTYKMSNELTLTKIMLQLSEFNITGMQIVYEGAGDSGSNMYHVNVEVSLKNMELITT